MSNVLQQKEIIIFNHKGIKIYMQLDYEQKYVSFIDDNGEDKNWKFVERGREYLGGWFLILEAMQEAVKYADTRLKEQEEARDKLAEERMVNIMFSLSELKEEN